MRTRSDTILSWIGLSSIPGVGRITFRKLLARFGSPEQALAAPQAALKEIDGLSDRVIDGIARFPWQELAETECSRAEKAGVSLITLDDSAYPENLRSTPDPPLYLYVKGALLPADRAAVAVVGTRRPTPYGAAVTRRIGGELAAAGVTVVSGMARGIDTQAHRGALAANGRTIAVLGCGIDVAYPPENRSLMEDIARAGAVVTENPFGTRPESGYFPARNRIISGLAQGAVIIEAAQDSGSLITAQYTREHGRKLFAVPGNIGAPTSRGPNSLIKQGAQLVETATDILRSLKIAPPAVAKRAKQPGPLLTADEESLLGCIGSEPKHIDAIAAETGLVPGRTGGVLITLELKGLVRQLPGKFFVREYD